MSRKKAEFMILLIRKSIDLALEYSRDVDFSHPEQTQRDADALSKRLEEIGEKCNAPALAEIRDKYPEIPWREIIGARHVMVHAYEVSLDWRIVKEICDMHLPPLRAAIDKILRDDFGIVDPDSLKI